MEFVSTMNLDFYLHQNCEGASLLDWNKRIRIAAEVARGLEREGLLGMLMMSIGLGEVVGGASKESDVYGSGVILLEILSERICEEGLLFQWILPLIKEVGYSEFLDPRLVLPSNLRPLVRLAKGCFSLCGEL
ncbi:hypothetical protein RJ641_018361 [Dillenia turbinata]|uniref:Serine-threonine/tyrosine-protein kinase catalytic domain-containing protein n=1 Tax=Dillenia turbinata TaxID=194707 RepID=A0AAN8YZ79_9MAGN